MENDRLKSQVSDTDEALPPLAMMYSTCQTVEGVIDSPDDLYSVNGDCQVDVRVQAGTTHGSYQITLNAHAPIKFQANQGDTISIDGHSISWNKELLSGTEDFRSIPFSFYPSDAPSGRTMNGIYGVKICTIHLEVGAESCTISQIDRPDRIWQDVGAEWSVGQKAELGYHFAEIDADESWLFVRLKSPIDGFEPEMTIQLQEGLRIMTEPENKPYYLQVGEGGSSAEISPFYLGTMFTDDVRIIVMRVQHDGRTEGKLPARITVRSETHNFWEDSTVLLATSKNADGSLWITMQQNESSQNGIAQPKETVSIEASPVAENVNLQPEGGSEPAVPNPLLGETSTAQTPSEQVTSTSCAGCNSPANVEWTHQFVAPYTMHRFDAYTNHLLPEVYPHLTLREFMHWFLINNPKVNRRTPVLYVGETYNFPQPARSSSR